MTKKSGAISRGIEILVINFISRKIYKRPVDNREKILYSKLDKCFVLVAQIVMRTAMIKTSKLIPTPREEANR